jgi:DNA-binding response OmpR family regulator
VPVGYAGSKGKRAGDLPLQRLRPVPFACEQLQQGVGRAAAGVQAGLSARPEARQRRDQVASDRQARLSLLAEIAASDALLALSAREFAVIEALLERPGAILSRAQLEERLYGWDEEIGSNTVEVYIHSLRKKLGAEFIRNVRGVGYSVQKGP